ncbi:Transposable element Tc3 transposase-like protein [Dinothrombium tinctorium]|uniref:Transposable element Tc3 transposase-like protein n=1 Tax=Dinothrombium tinctorium TaxID=1965070 RepID=A0A443R1A8_9ACAR|nr:Transposable element Tc3 transposase-like protein [Dinothrombium tinctorium]
MVWAAFSATGKTSIAFIDGRMNASKYQDLLGDYLLPDGPVIGGEEWLFQQDNAAIYRAASTMSWFTTKRGRILPWPSRSPDLNPIKNVLGILCRTVYANGRPHSSKDELKTAIAQT